MKRIDQNRLLKKLHRDKIFCDSASDDFYLYRWKAFDCLYCESTIDNNEYILNNGKWYQVDKDFSQKVNQDYLNLIQNSKYTHLPDSFKGEHEDDYNRRIADNVANLCHMDAKMIYHGGPNQKSEFCDLYDQNKKIYHVKRYGASSVFSHLFGQGLVSGEMFLSDAKYRILVNEKLAKTHKLYDVNARPNPTEYSIIFAVISSSPEVLNIPFFSKINIRNTKKRLEGFGYNNISLIKIDAPEKQ